MTKTKKRYYAIHAFGFPGYAFPKFWDSFTTLTSARNAAAQAIKDGWQMCEIMRDKPTPSGYFGIYRETIETVKA